LHGAAQIIQQKKDKVSSAAHMDIDKLIQEGVEKHLKLKEVADSAANHIKSENSFDFK